MTVLFVIFRGFITRLLNRRRFFWLALIGAAPAPILFLISQSESSDSVVSLYNDLTVTLGMSTLYPVVALIIATATLGQEWKSGTLPFLLVKPVSRWGIAAGALAAAAVASFVVIEAGVLLTWVVAGLVGGDWSVGVATTVAVAIQSVASAAIFVPLGLILGRATLVGLGYLLIWEGILSSIIAGIQASSVYRIVVSAWADLASLDLDNLTLVLDIIGRVEVGIGGAVAKVSIMALVSVMLTGLVLRHRDLIGE
ncbi:MAG: ABC transporter permease subunit [Acidimicrobiia bacterium]|nr:ABC transporter permease subunit [Acidimicrobiia bacterium]